MIEIFYAWGHFMPYVLLLGVLRVITDAVWRAFTRGDM